MPIYSAPSSPFARIGQPVPEGYVSVEEVARAVGFYEAIEQPLTLPDGTVVPDQKALVRGDTGKYLSTVGIGYKVVQFAQMADVVMRAGIAEGGRVETAGVVGKRGQRGWVLFNLGEFYVPGDDSPIKKHALVFNAHDGETACTLMNCAYRPICWNGIGAALREKDGARISIRHTDGALVRLEDAASSFRRMLQHYLQFEELMTMLVRQPYTDAMHAAAIQALIPIEQDGKKHTRLEKRRERMRGLFNTFIGITPKLEGTAYGALQAWTQAADWDKRPDESEEQDFRERVESNLFGSSSDKKAKALNFIVAQLQGRAPVAPVAEERMALAA